MPRQYRISHGIRHGVGAFWCLLEAGGNAVQEGVPGSGIGRVGTLFPDDTGQIAACRFAAYLDELGRFDAAFCRGRDKDRPQLIGSVKTNIDHLEPAARWAAASWKRSPGPARRGRRSTSR